VVPFELANLIIQPGEMVQSEITSAQAVTLGIPGMDVESGELGIIDDK
jgi:hypothetical protein